MRLDRSTVSRYAVLAAKPASNPPHGDRPGSTSSCEQFAETIGAAVRAGLSAQRIFQHLACEDGFGGSYCSVKRFVRRITRRQGLPFRRMECAAAEEMQVDFGGGAKTTKPGGGVRRPHLFCAVLSHSCMG
jgi:hypothetical protein